MMQSAEFQAQMRATMLHPAYQEAMKRTQELMKDPKKVAEVTAKMEEAVKEGKSQLDAAKTVGREVAAKELAAEEGVSAEEGDDNETEDVPEIEAVPLVGMPDEKKKSTNKTKKKKTNKKR